MCQEGGGATMEEGKKRAINNCIKQGAGRPYYFMGKWTFLLAFCLSFPTSFYASATTR